MRPYRIITVQGTDGALPFGWRSVCRVSQRISDVVSCGIRSALAVVVGLDSVLKRKYAAGPCVCPSYRGNVENLPGRIGAHRCACACNIWTQGGLWGVHRYRLGPTFESKTGSLRGRLEPSITHRRVGVRGGWAPLSSDSEVRCYVKNVLLCFC